MHAKSGSAKRKNRVFISYCRKDNSYLEQLLVHLKPLERSGQIEKWYDQQIQPGCDWPEEIEKALNRSSVALLLVSPGYLASDFIYDNELGPLLKAATERGMRILWVLVKDCSYVESPLQTKHAALSLAKPLDRMSPGERNSAWVEVCRKVKFATEARAADFVLKGVRGAIRHGRLADSEVATTIYEILAATPKLKPSGRYRLSQLISGILSSEDYLDLVEESIPLPGWQDNLCESLAPALTVVARSLSRSSVAMRVIAQLCDAIPSLKFLETKWPKKTEVCNDLRNRIYRACYNAKELECDLVIAQLKRLKFEGPKKPPNERSR